MCREHLLGEHVEIHMLAGSLAMKRNLQGFLKRGLIEPSSLKTRHDELALEMERRGFRHSSPIVSLPDSSYLGEIHERVVDSRKSREELISRCRKCRMLMEGVD